MKKFAALTVLFMTAIMLWGCSALNLDVNPNLTFSSEKEVLSYSAVITTSLAETATNQLMSSEGIMETDPAPEAPEQVDQVQPYLDMFERLMAGGLGLLVTSEVSDDPLYEFLDVFTVADLLGNPVTYKMYYNVLDNTETQSASILEDVEDNDDTLEPEDNDASDPDDDDDDDMFEDEEQEYLIEGILIMGEETFVIEGMREIEEEETKTVFVSKIDDDNYVRSVFKQEEDETKFYIEIYQNGMLVHESEIEIEDEEDEFKIELYIEEGENYASYEFKLETEDNENILKIEYETVLDGVTEAGEIKVRVMIDEVTGEPYYEILVRESESEEETSYRKDRDDDDDDEDEEDESEDDSEPIE